MSSEKTPSPKHRGLKSLADHPAIHKPLEVYAQQEYSTPLLVLRETWAGFVRHNIMGLSASLSFYALFAFIPLLLLIFFLLSHLIFSSDYAIVKLAILTGNLLPEFSSKIMVEVYQATQTRAAWGVIGLLVLLWAVTPLAGAMRGAFYTISSMIEAPSFIKRKLKDVISVLGILLLFFIFTSAGFVIENVVRFLARHFSETNLSLLGATITLLLTTTLICVFYRIFFPIRIAAIHLVIGALLTGILWLLMRPAFGLFLTLNHHYGSVFGSMKNMFVSISWLYLNFAVFLLGSELIATLHKKDMLLLRGLFDDAPNKLNYMETLMRRYGLVLKQNDMVFQRGNTDRNLYYLAEGEIHLINKNSLARQVNPHEFFGEMAILTKQPTTADAIVASEEARIIVIHAENMDAMLNEEPKVAMQLLRQLASRMQNSYT